MLAKELPIIPNLCNGIIFFEVAAVLHNTNAEFAVIDSAHKAKSRFKYRIFCKKSTAVPVLSYQTPTVRKTYRCTLVLQYQTALQISITKKLIKRRLGETFLTLISQLVS